MNAQVSHQKSSPGSNTSTLRSKDSGVSTMSSDAASDLRKKCGNVAGRPVTHAGPYMNVPERRSQLAAPTTRFCNLSLDSTGVEAEMKSNAARESAAHHENNTPSRSKIE
jgi:hypothetical protein